MKELRTFATAWRDEKLIEKDCPLCGGQASAKRWRAQGIVFFRCGNCGLWRQDPQPVAEAIHARYDDSYLSYETSRQMDYREIALKSLTLAGLSLRTDCAEAKPEILEIGCATGALLSSFNENGWRVLGVEVGSGMAEYARKTFGIDVRTGFLEEMHFADGRFDVIMALHLVEHLNDPGGFLAELRRIIKPSGSLYLITPNIDSFQALLRGQAWRSAIRDHLYLFSIKTLSAFLETKGFRVQYSATWGGWPAGMQPQFLKKPLDALAKAFGWGDVMILRAFPIASPVEIRA